MRSPGARLTLGVAAWIAFGAAAFFILQTERDLASRRTTLRSFDVVAREASTALAAVRTAQQAYAVPGQSPGFWMARVDTLLESASSRVDEMQQVVSTAAARPRAAVTDAATAVGDLRSIDKRARQYLNTGEPLMASDIVFTEGDDAATRAARLVEAARQAEYAEFDTDEARVRRTQFSAAAGATGLAALALALLVFAPKTRADEQIATSPAPATGPAENELLDSMRPQCGPLPVSPELPRETVPVLKAVVDLCTELNRVREVEDLNRLLARAAQILDASGLVVWIGSPGGSTLRPVLAHGYSPQTLARMPHVLRSGDNAAAAAYRTGNLQIVLSRPGDASGAVAAPMLSPGGCIGALTAEIRNGSETSDGVQALAAIVASQLATVLAASVAESEEAEAAPTRIASA